MDDIKQLPAPSELILVDPQPADQNAAIVYLAGLTSQVGRRTQLQCVQYIAGWLGGTVETVRWGALRFSHTAALRTVIAKQKYAPNTIRKYHTALRGVLLAAFRLGQMSADDYQRAIDLGKVRGERLPAGRYITKEELGDLFKVCNHDKNIARGIRDAAILSCLYFGGLRREEVVVLDVKDYNVETGELTIHHGKGQKDRTTYISNGGALAMKDWVYIRGNEAGPMFLAINKAKRVRPGRLSSQAIFNMVADRMHQTGIVDISPHDFRRTNITDLLDAGVDVVTVSHMSGHANPSTTARYDRRPKEAMKKAADALEVAYTPRTSEV